MLFSLSAVFLEWAARWSPVSALGWTFGENVGLFTITLLIGHVLVRRYNRFPVSEPAPPVTQMEIVWAGVCVLLNTLVTYAGWWLWRLGWIHIRTSGGIGRVLLDALVLLVFMDFAMYVLHRAAHNKFLYGWLHQLHHLYDNPRPLTLFVLNPLEVVSFGGLWLAVLFVYSATLLGMGLYLALNLAFGLVGHLGVDPFPSRWATHPVLRYVGGSAFHARHHHDGAVNFGFYSTVWDKIGGTLGPPVPASSDAQFTTTAPGMRA